MFRFPRLKQPRRTAHFAPLAPAALPWRIDATPSGGGDFLDLASPALDRCELFSGPLQGDAGRAARLATGSSPIANTVAYTFYTATGVPGTGRWNFAPPFPEDRLQITGLHGRLEVSLFGDKPTALRYRIIVDTLTTATPAHIQAPLSRTVVNALLGRGECPSTGASARRTFRVVAQFLAAYCGVREDDFWTCSTTWPATTSTS